MRVCVPLIMLVLVPVSMAVLMFIFTMRMFVPMVRLAQMSTGGGDAQADVRNAHQ